MQFDTLLATSGLHITKNTTDFLKQVVREIFGQDSVLSHYSGLEWPLKQPLKAFDECQKMAEN